MKTLIIGDTHLMAGLILPLVDAHIESLGIRHIIFAGDYTDQWDQTDNPALYFKDLQFLIDWKARKEMEGIQVTCLLGNHDIPYLIELPVSYTLKYEDHQRKVKELLLQLNSQISCWSNGFLISHGGYLSDVQVEDWHQQPLPRDLHFFTHGDLYEELTQIVQHAGTCRGGLFPYGSPVWADAGSEFVHYPSNHYPQQIVGHCPVSRISEVRQEDCRILAIDTFSLSHAPYWPHYYPLSSIAGALLLEGGQYTAIPIPEWTELPDERFAEYFGITQ